MEELVYNFICTIFWVAIVYGISQIITEATIFENVREFLIEHVNPIGHLVSCFLCTSVWVSGITSLLLYSPVTYFFDLPQLSVLGIFFNAMLGSTIAWFYRLWWES